MYGMGLPGWNQYLARINVTFSRTQHSDAGEARTLSLEPSTLPLSHCAPFEAIYQVALIVTAEK